MKAGRASTTRHEREEELLHEALTQRDQPAPAGLRGAPVQQILALQRTVGNACVAAMLSRFATPGGRVLARDGYQLQTPWVLGGPRPPQPGLLPGQLHLDPALEAAFPREELLPEKLLGHLNSVVLPPLPPPKPSFASPPTTATAAPPDPADPPGFERGPEPGSVGVVWGALMAVPEVKLGLEQVQHNVWGKLSSGDKTTLATTSITFGVAALGGVLATPGGRAMLGQLSGVALPVPAVPWLKLEFSSRSDLIGLGVHVDVGQLLPKSLGFGAAGPKDSGPPLYPDPSTR
ncbi:MAG: hypothetical protein H0W96_01990 [Solirubrobacterales bacterium]|nr:hypothetical protein [Solirubrobacterales bacterium]